MRGRLLLCTDLDRTLIPNGPQAESPGARERLARLVAQPHVTLAYVTGRHQALVEQAIAKYRLPVPDYVIADVGTSIYRVGVSHAWEASEEWQAHIAGDWNGLRRAGLLERLGDLPALRLQERSRQGPFKLSYYLPADADTAEFSADLSRRLEETGVRARLVWSIDEVAGVGLLDVLPERASKRHAIERLAPMDGFGLEETVFAGDSGNDLEVLVSPIPAVLVANSQPEVRERARRQAAAAGTADRLYLARGRFLGMNGCYSAGILEGIAHYHPHWLDLMEQDPDPAAGRGA